MCWLGYVTGQTRGQIWLQTEWNSGIEMLYSKLTSSPHLLTLLSLSLILSIGQQSLSLLNLFLWVGSLYILGLTFTFTSLGTPMERELSPNIPKWILGNILIGFSTFTYSFSTNPWPGKLTHRIGLSNQTHTNQKLYLVSSFTKKFKSTGNQKTKHRKV